MFYVMSALDFAENGEPPHLVDLDNNQKIVVLEIYFVARTDNRRYLLDYAIAREDVVVAKRRSNGKLPGVSTLAVYRS